MYSSFQASPESSFGSGKQMDALLSYLAAALEANLHSEAGRLRMLLQSRCCSEVNIQTSLP